MSAVSFLPAAESDYQLAFAWYSGRSSRAATRFVMAVNESVDRIAAGPEMYALIDDRHRRCLLRRFPYSLIFRCESTGILVVAVAHSRRSSAFWKVRGL